MSAAATPVPPAAQGLMQAWLAATPLMQAFCGPEGTVWAASESWCGWYGATPASAVGRAYRDVVGDERFARHGLHLDLARRGGPTAFVESLEPPGALPTRWARVHMAPAALPHGAVVVSLEDLTAERAREAVIARQREQISLQAQEQLRGRRMTAELEKMRTLLDWRTTMLQERNDMLQLLSHEIRQPLNNASAAMQATMKAILEVPSETSSPASSALLRAEHVLQQVIGTLDNALAAGTLLADGRHALGDTDLPTLVKLVLHDIAADMRGRVQVEQRTNTRTVQLHPTLMRLSLRNLLNNALAYSPAERPVVLRIDETEEPLALVLDVVDQGPGIDPALLPTLFDKGVRGPNTRHLPGAGLGLFIVRAVVEQHRGTVEALSNPGGGTVMRVVLPQGLAS